MNLGFTMSQNTITTMIVVFVIYSIIVVGFGAYVKFGASRGLSEDDKLKNFLTGGGGLGPLSVGMLIFTSLLSAGGAVGGPGTGYTVGFTWSVAVWAGFVYGGHIPLVMGKKIAILKHRIGANSIIQLFKHRYGNSKFYAWLLTIIITVFMGATVIGQFSGGGRVFAVLTGTGNYKLGVLIFALVTIIYTATGGIKSIAKVAVFQGFIMVITVITLYIGVLIKVTHNYDSVQGMMEWLAVNNPKLVVASTWPPLYTVGCGLLMSWCAMAMPNGIVACLTYKSSKAVIMGGIIGITCTLLYQFIMSGMGPFTYALSQTLTSGDYATAFTSVDVLPSAMAGLVIAGVASAIQSTIAAVLVLISSSIVIDAYKDIINPKADSRKLNIMSTLTTIVIGGICMLIALKPSDMVQLFINFTVGGCCSALMWPLLFGFYSKKANKEGAITSTIFGALTYAVTYLMMSVWCPQWYASVLGKLHPVIPGIIVSFLFMVLFTIFGKPVEKGRLQVWFGKNYKEEWAHM